MVDIYHSLATHLWNQARITLHQGKTVIWNKAGICPRGCHALEDAARRADPNAVVWRGNVFLEPQLQGLVVLGVPVGRPEFILAKLEAKSRQHNVLLDRITSVGDLQSAWCLLLYCAAARVNFWLRSVPPELSGEFAREHDAGVWRCMCQLLHIDPAAVDDSAKAAATLPLAAGGLGLRSAERLRHAAHWASWADMLKALSSRIPSVAANLIAALEAGETAPSIQSVLSCVDNLAGVDFVVPAWEAVVASSLPDEEEVDPAQPKHGWQSKATWVVDSAFRQHTIFPTLADDQAALLRSQAGPMASAAFIAIPSMKEDPH